MTQIAPKHLLVTGASSGIGAALVHEALAQGWMVSGCARRSERLHQLHDSLGSHRERFLPLRADVSDAASLDAAVAQAVAQYGPLSAVVANAGRGVDGEITQLTAEDLATVYDVNVCGVHRTLHACLPHLGSGARFVAVSSVAAFLPIPRMGAYCATKAALQSWVAAARMELQHRDIRVMACCPGTVSTEFFASAPKSGAVWDWRPGTPLQPQQVARCILGQIRKGRPRTTLIPWFAGIAACSYRHLPRLTEWVLRRALTRMRQRD
ncbi:MAG: SDR family NAD(P)-dependent oxidoreductase [Planctomycetota bacterium]|nr:MAG: SDR family NAD(P)-dependent oxidoreductase [Planctomycetota bacterium]